MKKLLLPLFFFFSVIHSFQRSLPLFAQSLRIQYLNNLVLQQKNLLDKLQSRSGIFFNCVTFPPLQKNHDLTVMVPFPERHNKHYYEDLSNKLIKAFCPKRIPLPITFHYTTEPINRVSGITNSNSSIAFCQNDLNVITTDHEIFLSIPIIMAQQKQLHPILYALLGHELGHFHNSEDSLNILHHPDIQQKLFINTKNKPAIQQLITQYHHTTEHYCDIFSISKNPKKFAPALIALLRLAQFAHLEKTAEFKELTNYSALQMCSNPHHWPPTTDTAQDTADQLWKKPFDTHPSGKNRARLINQYLTDYLSQKKLSA